MVDGLGPFVSFDTITRFRSFIACLVLAIAYVASLYINKSPFPRDHPKTVKQRFKSVAVVSFLAPFYIWLWSDERTLVEHDYSIQSLWTLLGVHSRHIVLATVLPLLLTMILFLGPLVLMYLEKELHFDANLLKCPSSWTDSINLRNYVMAPLTEEFVYRACMLPLLARSFGVTLSVIICPLFFGVAHIHHVIERLRVNVENPKDVWISTVFQFGYTTVFGAYSAFLFLRTGHLIGPVVCHSFCNFMGFPPIEQVPGSKYPKILAGTFVVGLISFLVLALPLTDPSWYESLYYPRDQTHVD